MGLVLTLVGLFTCLLYNLLLMQIQYKASVWSVIVDEQVESQKESA